MLDIERRCLGANRQKIIATGLVGNTVTAGRRNQCGSNSEPAEKRFHKCLILSQELSRCYAKLQSCGEHGQKKGSISIFTAIAKGDSKGVPRITFAQVMR
jgi:hypothetical protein